MKRASSYLKEATKLKKEKKYLEAIKMLDKAYEVGLPGDTTDDPNTPIEIIVNNVISIQDLLRKAMYLQLAGKSKEGFKYLENLKNSCLKKYDETGDLYYLEPDLFLQIGRFLDKEKKYVLALKNRSISYLIDSFLPYINSLKMNMKNDDHLRRGNKDFIKNYFKKYYKNIKNFEVDKFANLMSYAHKFDKKKLQASNIKKIENF
jgi:hypothetical protein|tara:strand:+ start:83 stop:697 length:615 start_codon:yes stop_codon:yes gene_type:complete